MCAQTMRMDFVMTPQTSKSVLLADFDIGIGGVFVFGYIGHGYVALDFRGKSRVSVLLAIREDAA